MAKPKKTTTSTYHIARILTEDFKGVISQTTQEKTLDKGLAPHPFKYEEATALYNKFGLINAAIDKYVDFIVGPGFYVTSKNKKAETIIEQFLQDTNFDSILRRWVRQALVKGTSPLEIGGTPKKGVEGLKVLNQNTIYVKRDNKGTIKGYVQKQNMQDKGIDFETYQIALLTFNTPEDNCYGLGIIYPVMGIVNNILGCEKDMHMLLRRKANSPIHIQLGNMDKDDIPTAEELDNFNSQLVYLNNKQEWTTGPNVNMKVIDFGNLGEKFDFVLKHDTLELYHSLQIPEIIMGSGNIAEGLGDVQMDTWMRRIQSFQSEIEKVVEEQLFVRILTAQGIQDHVEFEWGQPSRTEVNSKISQITTLLSNMLISPELHKALQMQLVELMKLDVTTFVAPAVEKKKEEELSYPLVPGELREEKINLPTTVEGTFDKDQLICGNCKAVGQAEEIVQLTTYKCKACKVTNYTNNITLKEWLGFNYAEFLKSIEEFIKTDKYESLLAKSEIEKVAGKLTENQIKKLKSILITKFREGSTMKEIQAEIRSQVKIKDLYKVKNEELELDASGNPIVQSYANQRVNMIARTETTRASAEGALKNYNDNGITQVQFLAAMSQRTCQSCESLNGKLMTVGEAKATIPVHVYCRCTWVPMING